MEKEVRKHESSSSGPTGRVRWVYHMFIVIGRFLMTSADGAGSINKSVVIEQSGNTRGA